MNEIILRGRPILRLRAFLVIVSMTALCLVPLFHQLNCGALSIRWKCEVYNVMGPYLGIFVFLAFFVLMRRFLLGQPIVILSREGIEACIYEVGPIPWAHIATVEIKRIRLAKTLLIHRRPETIRPLHRSFSQRLSRLFLPTPGADLHLSAVHVDRPLEHLKHWIDDGMRNAAAGVSPDPFFTAPY